MDISKVEERALIPLWGALYKRGRLNYHIDMVAGEYAGRPWYRFESRYVLMDINTGVIQFRAPVNSINEFIWNVIYKKKGSGTPVGEHVDVYVKGYKDTKHIATATIKGRIVSCNNIGKGRYVIEIQADKEIEVENVG